MGIRENIAYHLNEYKTGRGLSVREMAERLNIGLGTIQNCLHQRGNPSLDTLLYLAEQMEITPEELLMPRDHQQTQRERTKDYLLELKRILEDVT